MAALFPLPPYDLIDSVVISDTVGAGDVTLAAQGKVTVNGLGTPIFIRNVLSLTKTTGVAQTLQVTTIDTTSATVTVGVTQTFFIQTTSNATTYRMDIVPASTSVVTLKASIVSAVNRLLGPTGIALFTAVSTGSNTLTITEVSGTGVFITTASDTGNSITVTTPHVNSSGSLSEVQQYNANATGTLFTKYDSYVTIMVPEAGSQGTVLRKGHIIVWVEQNDAQFAAFNTAFYTNAMNAGNVAAASIPYLGAS